MELVKQNMIGGCGESLVAAEFLKRGIPVYRPVVDVGADLIIDVNGTLQRVQVKTTTEKKSTHKFHLGRRNPHRGKDESAWLRYDKDVIDWYALCIFSRGYIALLPGRMGESTITFSKRGLERLKQYEFGAVVDRMKEEKSEGV